MEIVRNESLGMSRDVLKASGAVAESLANRGEMHALRVFDFASKATQDAIAKGIIGLPESWKTLQIADTLARRAAGLDKNTDQTVSVNLAMFANTGGWTASKES